MTKQFDRNFYFGGQFLEEILYWIEQNYEPDEVFAEEVLCKWAEENGYIEKESE